MGDNRVLGVSPKLRSKSTESVQETLAVQVPNKDGINASRNAQDYKISTNTINQNSKLKINLSSGGGYSAIINKK